MLPVLFVVTTCAVAACGGDDGKDAAPAATAAESRAPERVGVTLAPSSTRVTLGASYRLTGAVDDPRAEVALYADAHPFDEPRFVRRLRPNEAGRFRTRVRPTRETRYWAVVTGDDAEGRSGAARVDVALKPKVRIVATSPTTGRATATWRGPGRLTPLRGARSCFYKRAEGRKAWRRIGCRAVERMRDGRLRATLRFRDARQRDGDRFVQCARLDVARGFSEYAVEGCGSRRLLDVETDELF